MKAYIKMFNVALCITITLFASVVDAKNTRPSSIAANYHVTKNGQPFANIKEQFTASGDTYKIESITKGIGVYALFGERKLTSVGDITEEGLRPVRFELQQGNNPKKALVADFDWATNTLRMQVKGAVKEAALSAGTQDLASYAYQFMFLPAPLKNTITVNLTTGKKLNQYNYKINAEPEIITSTSEDIKKTYKTLHLTPLQSDPLQTETKELWLSISQHYLPVQILLVDDNGQKLEQTLTELHID